MRMPANTSCPRMWRTTPGSRNGLPRVGRTRSRDGRVWNEQNSPDFLVGANAVAYTKLLKAAYPAFHAGYAPTTVVFGGVQYNDDKWIAQAYAAGAKG